MATAAQARPPTGIVVVKLVKDRIRRFLGHHEPNRTQEVSKLPLVQELVLVLVPRLEDILHAARILDDIVGDRVE